MPVVRGLLVVLRTRQRPVDPEVDHPVLVLAEQEPVPGGAASGETKISSTRAPSSRTTACPSLTTSRRLRGSFQAASIQSLSERRAVIRSTVPRASASSPRGPAEVT